MSRKTLNDKAVIWIATKARVSLIATELIENKNSLLAAFERERETTIEVQDNEGVTHKVTRVAGEVVVIDTDLLKQVLTTAQRKLVFPRKVVVTSEFDQEALDKLINTGRVIPNTVPYISKFIAPFIKDTPQKAGK